MRIFDGSCVLQAGAGDEACSSSNPTAGYAINATLLPPRAQIALFGAIFIEKRFLPRQARDRHEETLKQSFLQVEVATWGQRRRRVSTRRCAI